MVKKEYSVILTGGHAATPALGVCEEIRRRKLPWDLYWIGPASAMEGVRVTTAAEKVLLKYQVKVKKIFAGKILKRGPVNRRVIAYIKIPVGFIHAFFLVSRIKPDLVMSFGGYAALPVVFWSWFFGKPVIIHEQTAGAGLANRLSAFFSRKITVARKESLRFYPGRKTFVVGNPQFSKIFKVREKSRLGNPPVVYITGGSSGSQIINEAVEPILTVLLKKYKVIHQTGELNIKHFLEVRSKLQKNLRGRYRVFDYVSPEIVSRYFEESDVVVSRAGANSVSDILASKRPAVLIPIPWSIGDEQVKNAKLAESTGLVRVLNQEDLTPKKLLLELEYLIDNWGEILGRADTSLFDVDKNASARLVDLLVQQLLS